MRNHLKALVAVLLAMTLSLMFVVSCGDDDEEIAATADTTATAVPETSTSTSPEPVPTDFHIETAVELIGETLETAPEDYTVVGNVCLTSAHEGLDHSPRVILLNGNPGEDTAPDAVRPGYVVVAGQRPSQRCDFPLEVTDAIWLATDNDDLWLEIQCTIGGGVGDVAVKWEQPDGGVQTLRLWDYDYDVEQLGEIDPADWSQGDCVSPNRNGGPTP